MAKYDKNGFIKELDDGEIFVFGSNGVGAHMGGAAATAVAKFGAIYGQAEGLQGQSYAINTMDGPEGYTPEDVAPLFKDVPENVVLPKAFNV